MGQTPWSSPNLRPSGPAGGGNAGTGNRTALIVFAAVGAVVLVILIACLVSGAAPSTRDDSQGQSCPVGVSACDSAGDPSTDVQPDNSCEGTENDPPASPKPDGITPLLDPAPTSPFAGGDGLTVKVPAGWTQLPTDPDRLLAWVAAQRKQPHLLADFDARDIRAFGHRIVFAAVAPPLPGWYEALWVLIVRDSRDLSDTDQCDVDRASARAYSDGDLTDVTAEFTSVDGFSAIQVRAIKNAVPAGGKATREGMVILTFPGARPHTGFQIYGYRHAGPGDYEGTPMLSELLSGIDLR